MTEPPKPKRKVNHPPSLHKADKQVTGQITFSSSATTTTTSNPSTPSHLPRARAKVDVSNLPSPATNTRPGLPQSYSSSGSTTTTGRPALRNTTSSASLRSTTSTGSRARSPAHPLPSPSLNQNAARGTPTTSASTNARPTFRPSTSQTSTPVFRRAASSGRTSPVKESTARIRASAVTQNVFSGRSPQVNGGTGRGGEQDNIYSTPTTASGQGFFKRPSDVEPKLRARVTPTQAISTSPERYPPLLSPDSALDQPQSWRSQAQSYPSPFQSDTGVYGDRPRPSPTSVVSPTVAQHAIMSQIPLHPTASAPGSPHHPSTPLSLQRSVSIKSTARRMLPYNPTTQVPRLPTTPLSPEMRTVDLPMMTPTRTRSREDPIRRPSLLGSGTGRVDDGGLLNFDGPERTSDDTVVGSSGDQDKSIEGEQDISEIDILLDTEDDVVEARVNRKVRPDPLVIRASRANDKIADLEITNASLLAINRSLEGKHPLCSAADISDKIKTAF